MVLEIAKLLFIQPLATITKTYKVVIMTSPNNNCNCVEFCCDLGIGYTLSPMCLKTSTITFSISFTPKAGCQQHRENSENLEKAEKPEKEVEIILVQKVVIRKKWSLAIFRSGSRSPGVTINEMCAPNSQSPLRYTV